MTGIIFIPSPPTAVFVLERLWGVMRYYRRWQMYLCKTHGICIPCFPQFVVYCIIFIEKGLGLKRFTPDCWKSETKQKAIFAQTPSLFVRCKLVTNPLRWLSRCWGGKSYSSWVLLRRKREEKEGEEQIVFLLQRIRGKVLGETTGQSRFWNS